MSKPHKRVSHVDGFAAIDLKVFMEPDTDLWALMAVVQTHKWKANHGELTYDFIEKKTGWKRGKIGMVINRAVEAGFISTHNTGQGLKIEKEVGPMSWDEYRIACDVQDSDIENSDTSGSKNEHPKPKKQASEVQETGRSNNRTTQNESNVGNDPDSPQEEKTRAREKKSGTISQIEILETEIGKSFKEAHDTAIGLPYRFTVSDLVAYPLADTLGMDMELIKSALAGFFHPTSWHRQNHVVGFSNFLNQAQKYAVLGQQTSVDNERELAKYYEPWDSRHPFCTEDPITKKQQQDSYEATHGPWKPKADWKPGAK